MTATATRLGLISDTHGMFRPEIVTLFAGVDLIVHAGDVGGGAVLEELASIAPVEAVYGNVDDPHDPRLARARTLPVGLLTLHVSHGHKVAARRPGCSPPRYRADILVFGHTHRALVTRMEQSGRGPILVVNPGAAGPRRFNLKPSVAILTVVRRKH